MILVIRLISKCFIYSISLLKTYNYKKFTEKIRTKTGKLHKTYCYKTDVFEMEKHLVNRFYKTFQC